MTHHEGHEDHEGRRNQRLDVLVYAANKKVKDRNPIADGAGQVNRRQRVTHHEGHEDREGRWNQRFDILVYAANKTIRIESKSQMAPVKCIGD